MVRRIIIPALLMLAGVSWLAACKSLPAQPQHDAVNGVVGTIQTVSAGIPGFGLLIAGGAQLIGAWLNGLIDKATAGQAPATAGGNP